MMRSGIKGIAFCQAVKEQRPEADRLVGLFRKKPLCLLESKCVQVQDQPCPYDGPAGKSSSRRKMSVQNDINAEEHDDRHQDPGCHLQDGIFLWFVKAVPALLVLRAALSLLFVISQQDQDRAGGDKKHIGFSKGVERTVIQDHARHNIDGPRILQPVLDIFCRHLITCRIAGGADRREVGNLHDQDQDQHGTAEHGRHFIKALKKTVYPVMLRIIGSRHHLVQIMLIPFQLLAVRFVFLPRDHFHIIQIKILFPTEPVLHTDDPLTFVFFLGYFSTHRFPRPPLQGHGSSSM